MMKLKYTKSATNEHFICDLGWKKSRFVIIHFASLCKKILKQKIRAALET